MSLIICRNRERNFFLEHFSGNTVSCTGYCDCFQNTGQRVGEWLSVRKHSSILLALEALPYYVKGWISEVLESRPAWFLLGSVPLQPGEGETQSPRMTAFLPVDYNSCPDCWGHEMAGSCGRDTNQAAIKCWQNFTSRLSGRRGLWNSCLEEMGNDLFFLSLVWWHVAIMCYLSWSQQHYSHMAAILWVSFFFFSPALTGP